MLLTRIVSEGLVMRVEDRVSQWSKVAVVVEIRQLVYRFKFYIDGGNILKSKWESRFTYGDYEAKRGGL